MNAIRSILVGVDFSECSAKALRQAVRIASWTGAKVLVRNVVEPVMYDLAQPVAMANVPSPTELVEDARDMWDRFSADMPGRASLVFETIVGYPVGEMVHAAGAAGVDLVVIGAHSATDAHRHLGAIAAGIARHAPCDVLLVRQDQSGPYKSVLAAVDFSPASLEALGDAVRVAVQDGAALHVLHTYADPWSRSRRAAEMERNMPDFRQQYAASIRKRMEEFAAPLRHELAAIKAVFHAVQDGAGARGIVQFARDHPVDLAVLGSRGHSRVHDLFFGTTAERVVREAACSVLVVRPAAVKKA